MGLILHNILCPKELLKYVFLVIVRYANSIVFNFKIDLAIPIFYFYFDVTALFNVTDGVIQEILNDQLNMVRIGNDVRRSFSRI